MSLECTRLPSLEQYMAWAEHYIDRCRKMKSIKGASKLERRCAAELRFLTKLVKKKSPRPDSSVLDTHLKSSNLSHYAAIIHVAETLPDVTHLLQPFSLPERQDNLIVDVIALKGHLWMKVIARKAQALHLIWAGQGQFGEKDIIKQAEEYLKCTECHPHNYQQPKLHFTFYGGITHPMAEKLEEMGITVWGNRVDVSEDVEKKLKMEVDSEFKSESGDDFSDNDIFQYPGDSDSNADDDDEGYAECLKTADAGESSQQEFHNQPADIQVRTDLSSASKASDDQREVDDDCLSCEGTSNLDLYYQSNVICDATSKDSTTCVCPDIDKDILGLSGLFLLVPDYSAILQSSSGPSGINKVNLDITTLLTLVAGISHGRHNFLFKEKVLTDQAAEERQSPVLPAMLEFLKGKEVFACETAIHAFKTILNTLAGPNEKQRAEKLLEEIKIVPDDMSERCKNLPLSAKLKHRSKIIFGTGDKLQAVTMTANSGFVRAAKHQGVLFSVFFHQARALTEMKESLPTTISQEPAE